MPLYVCSQLDDPNWATGLQTCEQWQEMPAQTFLGLPDITLEQAETIILPLVLALVTVATIRYLKKVLENAKNFRSRCSQRQINW